MSIDATRWAWTAPVKNSSQRLVLLSLADRAGEHHTAWPSIDRLAKDTALNEKTVQKVILELINIGLVIDTLERTGPTKRVRILKLNGVKGREEYAQKRVNTKDGNDTENGLVKPPITNPNLEDNEPKNGICNEPKNGIQNQPLNLSMNLSEEHEWIPDQNQLIAVLNSAGQQQNLDLIFGLPDFEFQLGAFNAHYAGQVMPNARKLYSFVRWIIDKFERYQKANPNYVKKAVEQSQLQQAQPLINLPLKPKGLLGSAQ
ncbi:MAG: helix-turn-helix domain-containing protein [Acinetobacter sp.]|uniref:helix-turn-helix domain-containing protein n=1 Tax=Acinetobacter sp. TaxID=472 RepID=UPI003982A718